MTPNKVQTLFEMCKKTFTGGPPSSLAIQKLRAFLDTFSPSDVGLGENTEDQDRGYGFFGQNLQRNRLSSIVPRWSQNVTYLHICECERFSIGIFCLPTSQSIPLHDHPGMTVLSKLLYGSMHVKAYDWVDPFNKSRNNDVSQSKLAKLVVDNVTTVPSETNVLFPTSGGNIHCFTAVTACAVLDVLAPPYSENEGRNCTYYRDYPNTVPPGSKNNEEQDYAWLEIDHPDFLVHRGEYNGPKVV